MRTDKELKEEFAKRLQEEYRIEFEKALEIESDEFWKKKTDDSMDEITKEYQQAGCEVDWKYLKGIGYEGIAWSPLQIMVEKGNHQLVLKQTELKKLRDKEKRFIQWFFEGSGFGSEQMEIVIQGKKQITAYVLLYHGDKKEVNPEKFIEQLEIEENTELTAQWKTYLMKHMFENEEQGREELEALTVKTLMWKMNDVIDKISELVKQEMIKKRESVNRNHQAEFAKEQTNRFKKAGGQATKAIEERYSHFKK